MLFSQLSYSGKLFIYQDICLFEEDTAQLSSGYMEPELENVCVLYLKGVDQILILIAQLS